MPRRQNKRARGARHEWRTPPHDIVTGVGIAREKPPGDRIRVSAAKDDSDIDTDDKRHADGNPLHATVPRIVKSSFDRPFSGRNHRNQRIQMEVSFTGYIRMLSACRPDPETETRLRHLPNRRNDRNDQDEPDTRWLT
jgi:hypothetical protein